MTPSWQPSPPSPQAGLPVLADKPWLTESRQLPYLVQVTTGPRVAMDLMTSSYSLRAQVMAQVIRTPELFGTFVTHEAPEPAIELASVHHLYKQVNGRPLQRPGWYYDTAVQGDGVVDVQPTFKGSECLCCFFGVRARHTTRRRDPVPHRPADDGGGHQRAA